MHLGRVHADPVRSNIALSAAPEQRHQFCGILRRPAFAIVVWPGSHYCSGMKPNYQYEKRQRELEKKKKKAEKELKKTTVPETPPVPETVVPQDKTKD